MRRWKNVRLLLAVANGIGGKSPEDDEVHHLEVEESPIEMLLSTITLAVAADHGQDVPKQRVDPSKPAWLGPPITISTIHTAKGREWDSVVVVGVEEHLIPHHRSVAESFQGPLKEKSSQTSEDGEEYSRVNVLQRWKHWMKTHQPDSMEGSSILGDSPYEEVSYCPCQLRIAPHT